MPTTPDMTDSKAKPTTQPSEDLATILSKLPSSGADDTLTRVLAVYEPAERGYRAGARAGKPVIGASTSSNR